MKMNFSKGILTKVQLKHYSSIRWLLDDGEPKKLMDGEEFLGFIPKNRQSGRSMLMAIIFINMAMERPGEMIRVFDHTGEPKADQNMMFRIQEILKNDPVLVTKFSFHGRRIRYNA
jgi:hypothetical protein